MDDYGSIFPEPEEIISERAFLQMNSEEIEKRIRERAKLFRLSYQALRSEGFNEEQAFQILAEQGPNLG